MSTGKIKTLFSDPNKTEIVYPKTKLNAISDNDGIGLEAILSTTVHAGASSDDDVVTTVPNDAETLGGFPAGYFIGREEVENNYATKEELNALDYEDVGAAPAGNYATESFVTTKIAEAQLGNDNNDTPAIDLSGYATKDDLAAINFPVKSVNNKTGEVQLTASDVGAASVLMEKLVPSFAAQHTAPNDLLNVYLNGDYTQDCMQPSQVATEDASTLVNSPLASGAFYAFRTVESYNVGHACVRLHEMYPNNGRVWSNMYDKNQQNWMGWVSNVGGGSIDLSAYATKAELNSKAPAGYGLGETAQGTKIASATEVDSIKKNGWYALWADYNITFAGYTDSFFTLEVSMFNDNYGRHTLYLQNGSFITRTCRDRVWGEWEWENPPMTPGVEYRTTERINGKAVYKCAKDVGNSSIVTECRLDGESTWSLYIDKALNPNVTTITTGSADDILIPLTLRDIRTDNDELRNVISGNGTQNENYAYITTTFLNSASAGASKIQTAVGYTYGYTATRAYYANTGWKPWNMSLTTTLNSYSYGTTLPAAGTQGRIFFKKA